MNRILLTTILIFLSKTTVNCEENPTTFLPKTCNEAQDCYVFPDKLHLACYYDQHKCNCQTTINSIHRVESRNGKCLMSKYGPCSLSNKELSVDCMDGFQCIENQCRDPNSRSVNVNLETPFEFDKSCEHGGGCTFTDNLQFQCSTFRTPQIANNGKCECNRQLVADGRSTVWDLRNYDDKNNCSVGRFGPCGEKNGIKVDCHGKDIKCINGRCMDPNKLISKEGDLCEDMKDCTHGLICSLSYKCVKPNSLEKNAACRNDNECKTGLKCTFRRWESRCG